MNVKVKNKCLVPQSFVKFMSICVRVFDSHVILRNLKQLYLKVDFSKFIEFFSFFPSYLYARKNLFHIEKTMF